MTAASTRADLPSRPLTRSDLVSLPEDGHRYELIDGTLIMSPAPGLRHQRAVGRLWRALDDVAPDSLEVVMAPFAVGLAEDTEVQPDVLVARREDLTERDLPAPPVLAVEILSPSSRGIDRLLKRERYERAGVACYWILDPVEPSLVCLELDAEGRYVEVAGAVGAETVRLAVPYAVAITPAALVED